MSPAVRGRSRVTDLLIMEVAHRGLRVYRVGETRMRWGWNQYGQRRIGVAFRLGQVAFSLRWGRLP